MYLLSDLLAGKLIPLLTCGQSNPMEIACKSPEAAHRDTDGNGVRRQQQPHPGNQSAAVRGVQGKWGPLALCFAAQHFARVLFWLCLRFSLAYWVFKRTGWGKLCFFSKWESNKESFSHVWACMALWIWLTLLSTWRCRVSTAPLWKAFSALAPWALNAFSSRPAFCFWEIICIWDLRPFSIWKKKHVHPAVALTYGKSFSSGLQAVRGMGWAELPYISQLLREGTRAASIRPVFTESLVSSGFPYSNETIGESCSVLSMLPLYSDIICEFLQIIDDWDHYCFGKEEDENIRWTLAVSIDLCMVFVVMQVRN